MCCILKRNCHKKFQDGQDTLLDCHKKLQDGQDSYIIRLAQKVMTFSTSLYITPYDNTHSHSNF